MRLSPGSAEGHILLLECQNTETKPEGHSFFFKTRTWFTSVQPIYAHVA